jgi:hypothetical protein
VSKYFQEFSKYFFCQMGAKKLKILCETFLGEKLNWNNLPNLTTNNWPEVGSSRPIKLDVSGKRKEKME